MKLSVIIPVYNVEEYIEECVYSINKQTLNNDLFEVLFVNDESKDSSVEKIEKSINKNLNYKILNKKNGGLSDARNYGVKNSNSEYIMFIDSDDYVHKDFFKKMVEKMETTDSDFACCETIWVYENKEVVEQNKIKEPKTVDEKLDNLFSTSIAAWNKIYKREIFNDNEFTKGLLFEDLDFIFKIIDKYNQISFVNEPLYYYRQGRQTSILNVNSVKDFNSYRNIFNKNILKYDTTKYMKYVEAYFIRRVLLSLSKKYIGSSLENELTLIIEEFKNKFPNLKSNNEFRNNSILLKIWITLVLNKNYFILKLIKLIML